jgi:hypothetical protein
MSNITARGRRQRPKKEEDRRTGSIFGKVVSAGKFGNSILKGVDKVNKKGLVDSGLLTSDKYTFADPNVSGNVSSEPLKMFQNIDTSENSLFTEYFEGPFRTAGKRVELTEQYSKYLSDNPKANIQEFYEKMKLDGFNDDFISNQLKDVEIIENGVTTKPFTDPKSVNDYLNLQSNVQTTNESIQLADLTGDSTGLKESLNNAVDGGVNLQNNIMADLTTAGQQIDDMVASGNVGQEFTSTSDAVNYGSEIGGDIASDVGTDVGADIAQNVGTEVTTEVGTNIASDVAVEAGTELAAEQVATTAAGETAAAGSASIAGGPPAWIAAAVMMAIGALEASGDKDPDDTWVQAEAIDDEQKQFWG